MPNEGSHVDGNHTRGVCPPGPGAPLLATGRLGSPTSLLRPDILAGALPGIGAAPLAIVVGVVAATVGADTGGVCGCESPLRLSTGLTPFGDSDITPLALRIGAATAFIGVATTGAAPTSCTGAGAVTLSSRPPRPIGGLSVRFRSEGTALSSICWYIPCMYSRVSARAFSRMRWSSCGLAAAARAVVWSSWII